MGFWGGEGGGFKPSRVDKVRKGKMTFFLSKDCCQGLFLISEGQRLNDNIVKGKDIYHISCSSVPE